MKRILVQFTRRDAHPVVQFVKYAIAGGVATAVDVLVFYLCAIVLLPALTPDDPVARLLGLQLAPLLESVRSDHYVWDKVIAFLFSNLTAYVANVLWVFTPGRHSRVLEFTLFFLVSATSFVLGTALGWVLISGLGLPTTYAYLANGVASLAINYVCRKYVVFKG
ncbi:MAG: GtrA family protein [Elusimicrobiota bacterium]|jgi:putative flippase GtrA